MSKTASAYFVLSHERYYRTRLHWMKAITKAIFFSLIIFVSLREQYIWVFPKYYISKRLFEPATSCVRDQDATTAPARPMWGTRSLKGLEPATYCVRDQDATTAPARPMWETRSLKGLEPATYCVRDQDATTAPAKPMWETGSLKGLKPATICVRD